MIRLINFLQITTKQESKIVDNSFKTSNDFNLIFEALNKALNFKDVTVHSFSYDLINEGHNNYFGLELNYNNTFLTCSLAVNNDTIKQIESLIQKF